RMTGVTQRYTSQHAENIILNFNARNGADWLPAVFGIPRPRGLAPARRKSIGRPVGRRFIFSPPVGGAPLLPDRVSAHMKSEKGRPVGIRIPTHSTWVLWPC